MIRCTHWWPRLPCTQHNQSTHAQRIWDSSPGAGVMSSGDDDLGLEWGANASGADSAGVGNGKGSSDEAAQASVKKAKKAKKTKKAPGNAKDNSVRPASGAGSGSAAAAPPALAALFSSATKERLAAPKDDGRGTVLLAAGLALAHRTVVVPSCRTQLSPALISQSSATTMTRRRLMTAKLAAKARNPASVTVRAVMVGRLLRAVVCIN